MEFFKSHKLEQTHDDEEDLTTLLDTDQRAELTVLLANATQTMRQAIEANFDASKLKQDTTTKLGDEAGLNPNVETSPLSAEEQEAAGKAEERRRVELSAPKLQELKGSCLHFFDQWSDSVISRVGEVVNSRETANKQHEQASRQDSAPGGSVHDAHKDDETLESALIALYPPISTPLASLAKEKRVLILHSVLLLLLSLEHYLAHSRVLLIYLTTSLHLSPRLLADDEAQVAHGLLEAAKHMSGEAETQQRSEANKSARRWKVGLASVAGAAIIGVTGGLAAPLLAAGIGGVMGGLGLGATAAAGYLGTLASSGVLVGSLFGAYGGRMTGQMMDQYAREVEDFAFVPVRGSSTTPSPADRRLRVSVGISGWLTEKEEVVSPWRVLGTGREVFALRWELDALLKLGNSLTALVKSAAWGYAKSEIIKRTIFASLTAALWPIGLLKVSRIVDNPFSVAKSRSDKAGMVLADALINKAQGERPVTLLGYSLGARVIYSCLMNLAARRAFGLVESVILIGAPAPSTATDWRVMRSVVAGRLVNVYSVNDYVLGFLYRTSSIQYGIAGLQPIEGVPGVEDVDVSDLVSSHQRYRYLIGSILKKIGFEDLDLVEVGKEEAALKVVEMEEKKEEHESNE
ncbi:MAG: hypothetical protein M1838_003322 [Thelocarpon superellum]|nr:MAG: hypothetical protein M1838_003322 [Thelocarpon superellum]